MVYGAARPSSPSPPWLPSGLMPCCVDIMYLVLDALDHAVDLVLHLARDGGELLLDGGQLLVQHALLLHLGCLLV